MSTTEVRHGYSAWRARTRRPGDGRRPPRRGLPPRLLRRPAAAVSASAVEQGTSGVGVRPWGAGQASVGRAAVAARQEGDRQRSNGTEAAGRPRAQPSGRTPSGRRSRTEADTSWRKGSATSSGRRCLRAELLLRSRLGDFLVGPPNEIPPHDDPPLLVPQRLHGSTCLRREATASMVRVASAPRGPAINCGHVGTDRDSCNTDPAESSPSLNKRLQHPQDPGHFRTKPGSRTTACV